METMLLGSVGYFLAAVPQVATGTRGQNHHAALLPVWFPVFIIHLWVHRGISVSGMAKKPICKDSGVISEGDVAPPESGLAYEQPKKRVGCGALKMPQAEAEKERRAAGLLKLIMRADVLRRDPR